MKGMCNTMTRNQKLFGIVAVLIVVLALGAVSTYAQGPYHDDMPFGMHGSMMGNGHHGMMRGGGMMVGNNTMFALAAETLGLEPEALWNELRSGKNLLDIAQEQGVETTDLQAALLSGMQEHMAYMVENGYLSQEDADEMLAYMTENITEHLSYMFGGGRMNWDSTSHPCWEYFQSDED